MVASHWEMIDASRSSSPVSTATSTAPAARYSARTAWPRNTVASRIGMSSWKYAWPKPISPSVPRAAPIDEQRGLVEVALLAGHAGHLDQAHLDLRVTADALDPAADRTSSHTWSATRRGDLHELVVARGPRSRHAGLQEVAEVVQLVPPLEVAVPRLLARTARTRC